MVVYVKAKYIYRKNCGRMEASRKILNTMYGTGVFGVYRYGSYIWTTEGYESPHLSFPLPATHSPYPIARLNNEHKSNVGLHSRTALITMQKTDNIKVNNNPILIQTCTAHIIRNI